GLNRWMKVVKNSEDFPKLVPFIPSFDVGLKKMKRNYRLAIGLALVGIVSLLVMVAGAAIEMVLGQTFAVGDGMAMIWIWGFIVLPILLAMVVFQPRIILLAIAMAIPLGLMFYGAVNHIDIHTKWYFWII